MYLFAFVFLMVGVLGLYTEIYGLSVSRMFGGQTTMADTMLTWHNAAVGLAQANRLALTSTTGGAGTAGCSLSPLAASTSQCLSSAAVLGTYTPSPLPNNYNITSYKWNSYAYQTSAGGPLYVITWAPMPASGKASDPVTVPAIGMSLSDLYRQIQNNNNIPLFAYGQVASGKLQTKALIGTTTQVVFTPLPTAASIGNGSVAIVSMP
jgi:hypothetical protein